jgi:pimeloyl-ACP methyl ester carboxylesterase
MPLAETVTAGDALPSGLIAQPHRDIELGVRRTPLAYFFRAPATGISPDTGLILYLGGYGMNPRDGYTASLLTYLANRHNCVAATVDYFGARLIQGIPGRIVPHPDFFAKLAQHYGISITAPKDIAIAEILANIAALLAQNGITQFHEECIVFNNADDYNSMGFLPALDGLQVVHRMLSELSLDKTRLFLLGTSYGGHIVSLMAKLAPQTFRMVVDNSGFSSPEDDQPALLGWQKLFLNGVGMLCQNVRHWSLDARDTNFFSPARQAIRDLRRREHVFANTARVYAYHASTDRIAPTARKIELREAYRDRIAYDLAIIEERDIDGRLFKNLTHGMNASLRGLFDLSSEKFQGDGGATADTTDFDRGAEYIFACGCEDYAVEFSTEYGVHVALRSA